MNKITIKIDEKRKTRVFKVVHKTLSISDQTFVIRLRPKKRVKSQPRNLLAYRPEKKKYLRLYAISRKVYPVLKNKESSTLYSECIQSESYKALLLSYSSPQITFAMKAKELDALQDLLRALFQLNSNNYLSRFCYE